MATVRDINDIREIFIEATGSAYINAGHVFDMIVEEHIARHTPELLYSQEDLDTATEEAYRQGYDDAKWEAAKGNDDAVH